MPAQCLGQPGGRERGKEGEKTLPLSGQLCSAGCSSFTHSLFFWKPALAKARFWSLNEMRKEKDDAGTINVELKLM